MRYEGVIDALGLELKELCALPPELVRKLQRVIDHLRSDEIALKKEGRWAQTDFLNYSASILQKIDQIFYKPSDFVDFRGIEELARVDLTEQRFAAVVEADMGIYEIEPHLNKLYGNRLGIVFLKKGPDSYTVRQMDLFMPITLEEIYDRLNFVDPAVKCRTRTNKWGGAADIGGSPRETGTRLTPAEIAQSCREATARHGVGKHLYRFCLTAAMIALVLLIAYLVRVYWEPGQWTSYTELNRLWSLPQTGFILTLIAASGGALMIISYCRPWQYGWIRSVGNKWWFIFPLVLISGMTGGVWAPIEIVRASHWTYGVCLYVLAMPLASEMLFRSLAHGLLTNGARTQRYDTRWFFSWPVVGSTILYTGFISLLCFANGLADAQDVYWQLTLVLFSAAVFGLSLGMVRERSQSLFPTILFHILAAAATVAYLRFFG